MDRHRNAAVEDHQQELVGPRARVAVARHDRLISMQHVACIQHDLLECAVEATITVPEELKIEKHLDRADSPFSSFGLQSPRDGIPAMYDARVCESDNQRGYFRDRDQPERRSHCPYALLALSGGSGPKVAPAVRMRCRERPSPAHYGHAGNADGAPPCLSRCRRRRRWACAATRQTGWEIRSGPSRELGRLPACYFVC
jgi:hypothetical protein